LIEQAEALGEKPEDPLLLFWILHAEWLAKYVAFEGEVSCYLADQLLTLAKRETTSGPLLAGHRAMGTSLLHVGELAEARTHFDRAIQLYTPAQHRSGARHGVVTRYDVEACSASASPWCRAISATGLTTLPFNERNVTILPAKGRKIMRRREFIGAVGAAALAVTATGNALAEQSKRARRVAIVLAAVPVSQMTETSGDPFFQGLFSELRHLGYVEGQNLLIERYSDEGRASQHAALARAVVSGNPDLIIAVTNSLVLDFKAATTTIPIVGVIGVPVEAGIVASLARPGGNITGVSVDVGREQWGKRIQLLQQIVPQTTRLGVLESRAVREQQWATSQRELQWMGITEVGPAFDHPVDEDGYRRVFAALTRDGAEAVLVTDEEENIANFKLIVELAEKTRLPAIYTYKMFVEAGGLMSYGTDVPALASRVADMADQILKGAAPADTPIQQPTKFELAINLKTAKALGLAVPPALLATADEVIE
jgi:putative tryptophan/tyrosine transport system substrate-binding protein